MQWTDVGDWLKANGGTGAALIGALLVGNPLYTCFRLLPEAIWQMYDEETPNLFAMLV